MIIVLATMGAGVLLAVFLKAVVNDQPLQMWLLGVFGLPFAAGCLYTLHTAIFVKIRFNAFGIEYSKFGKWSSVSWDDVHEIASSILAGSVIITSSRRLGFSDMMAGFQQLIEEAEKHGVKIDALFKSNNERDLP